MLGPEALPGEVSASGPMFWIARAGGKRSLSEMLNVEIGHGFRLHEKNIQMKKMDAVPPVIRNRRGMMPVMKHKRSNRWPNRPNQPRIPT